MNQVVRFTALMQCSVTEHGLDFGWGSPDFCGAIRLAHRVTILCRANVGRLHGTRLGCLAIGVDRSHIVKKMSQ